MESIRVLLVDNDEDAREGLCRLLSHKGYTVDAAADALEALECVQRHPYDLVITDLRMPGVDGLALLQRLKDAYPRLPVLLITAFGDWGSYARAIGLGASAYLTKPFRSDELLREVQGAVRKRKDEAGGRTPSSKVSSGTTDRPDR